MTMAMTMDCLVSLIPQPSCLTLKSLTKIQPAFQPFIHNSVQFNRLFNKHYNLGPLDVSFLFGCIASVSGAVTISLRGRMT